MNRIAALLAKDLAELRRSPGIFVPALLAGCASVLYPFVIAIIVPYLTGERLADSSDFEIAIEMYRNQPGTRQLSPEGAIQAFLFQHALVLMVAVTTVTGGMSVAAHSVIGEKQARTLEPLLATPVKTAELLVAKILGAALPGLALMALFFGIYVAAVAALGEAGVWAALFTPASLGLVFVMGPLAAFVGLQLAVCASSRVNDPRSAQQIGALVIIVPVVALQMAQFLGGVVLTAPLIFAAAVALGCANAILLVFAVAIFDRESILTRWK